MGGVGDTEAWVALETLRHEPPRHETPKHEKLWSSLSMTEKQHP